MALLTNQDYPAVRAALDVSLSPSELSDSVIGLPIFQGKAEAEVIDRIPDAQALVDAAVEPDHQRVKNAAIYLTAALIAIRNPQITRDAFAGISVERKAQDVAALERDLRALANSEITAVIGTPVAATRPPFMTLGQATRGALV